MKYPCENCKLRAQIMWGGSLMHNGLTGCGVEEDWATHQLEHELSGMFDVTHGAGLAAVWPSWARYGNLSARTSRMRKSRKWLASAVVTTRPHAAV